MTRDQQVTVISLLLASIACLWVDSTRLVGFLTLALAVAVTAYFCRKRLRLSLRPKWKRDVVTLVDLARVLADETEAVIGQALRPVRFRTHGEDDVRRALRNLEDAMFASRQRDPKLDAAVKDISGMLMSRRNHDSERAARLAGYLRDWADRASEELLLRPRPARPQGP